MNNGSNWMVGGQRVQFGMQVDVWGIDPDSCRIRIRNFNIRMHLCDWDSQRGASIHNCMFAK